MHTRTRTVVAITNVEMITIEESDYLQVQERASIKVSVDEKYNFLKSISLFNHWDSYKLFQLAYKLKQTEIPKGTMLIEKGQRSNKLNFIFHGTVHLLSKHSMIGGGGGHEVIAVLQRGSYYGESVINNVTSQQDKSRRRKENSSQSLSAARRRRRSLQEKYSVFSASHLGYFC